MRNEPTIIYTSPKSEFDDPQRSDLTSFPSSVQARLSQAQQLLEGRTTQTIELVEAPSVMAELAKARPELLALVIAAQMGFKELVFEEEQTDSSSNQNNSRLLGLNFCGDATGGTTTGITKRTIRFA